MKITCHMTLLIVTEPNHAPPNIEAAHSQSCHMPRPKGDQQQSKNLPRRGAAIGYNAPSQAPSMHPGEKPARQP